MKSVFLKFLLFIFIISYSCKTVEENKENTKDNSNEIKNENKTENYNKENKSLIIEQLLIQASSILNQKPNAVYYVNNKKFVLDCVGTISAIFYGIGIDILKDSGLFWVNGDNGVALVYKSLKDKSALHTNVIPEVGDIIFWGNTWDRNGDGQFGNDPLTHVGLVTKIDEDGTIHYLHENYFYGVVIEMMNLKYPEKHKDENGKIINSPLYIGSSEYKKPNHAWTAGELFKEFGSVLKVKDKYNVE